MRKRHYNYNYPIMYPYKKKRKGGLFVILIIIGLILYIYFSNTGSSSFNLSHFLNSNSSNNQQNNLIQTCNKKVIDCGQIIQSKYESSLTILKTSKVNTTLGANQFIKTWGASSQINDINYYDVSLPVILIATRLDNSDRTKTPHVFICKSDGTLEEKSTMGLC